MSATSPKPNASLWFKIFQTILMTLATMWAGVASAVISGANESVSEYFHVSSVVSDLANGMFVIGFALGPCLFGPLSEIKGRKWPLAFGLFVASLFSVQAAAARNIGTLLVGRFLGGVFGAAPYAIGGGFFHDIYDEAHVQGGIAFFAVATAGGPALGPIIGAGLAVGTGTWRWAEWFVVIFGFTTTALVALGMKETYAPVILASIAKERRKEDNRWFSELDLVKFTPKDVIFRYMLRPIHMLFCEPILATVTLYMSFVYALLYMLMAALPVIYGEYRGMETFASNLPLFSVFLGILCGGGVILLDMLLPKDKPEAMFKPMGLGAIMLPIGLFWFAFTGPAQVHSIWPSIVSLGFAMCGMVLIFECGIVFLVGMYGAFANSAIAANTIARSLLGGSLPLVTAAMVRNLGTKGSAAMALLAGISVLLAPIPVIFFYWGPKLRAMSKFKPEL